MIWPLVMFLRTSSHTNLCNSAAFEASVMRLSQLEHAPPPIERVHMAMLWTSVKRIHWMYTRVDEAWDLNVMWLWLPVSK